MSQKLELNIDEVVVLENHRGHDTILLNIRNSEAIKKVLPKEAVALCCEMLVLDIITASLHGEKLAKELGLIPDRIVKV